MRDLSGKFELTVHPQGRSAADEYYFQGNTFIEGRDNSVYTLRFSNNSSHRVLAIFGVDGLCIQTGKPAGHESPGYVVNPYSKIEIPGWSLNKDKVAEFFFSRKEDSYVNAIGGNSSNAGVIGCMVFEEYQPPSYFYSQQHFWTHTAGSPMSWNATTSGDPLAGRSKSISVNQMSVGSSSASPPNMPVEDSLGTGIGDEIDFKVTDTVFNRKNKLIPDATIALYYNSAKNLQKMGIQLKGKRYNTVSPNPFPGTSSYGVIPPRNWRG